MQSTDSTLEQATRQDLLYGASAIAAAVGLTRRQVYHAVAASYLPVFRIGATICARRSSLHRWFATQEGAAEETVRLTGAKTGAPPEDPIVR